MHDLADRAPTNRKNTAKGKMSETLLDVRGLSCPLPVLKANRALRALSAGSHLRVLATDRTSVSDFKAFCKETGHALIAFGEESGVLSFTLRKRADPEH